MTTIEAPRIAGRGRARQDVAPLNLSRGLTLIVQFPSRSSATPSYLDELIAVVCSETGANLEFRGLSERAIVIADECAARQGVSHLLRIAQ